MINNNYTSFSISGKQNLKNSDWFISFDAIESTNDSCTYAYSKSEGTPSNKALDEKEQELKKFNFSKIILAMFLILLLCVVALAIGLTLKSGKRDHRGGSADKYSQTEKTQPSKNNYSTFFKEPCASENEWCYCPTGKMFFGNDNSYITTNIQGGVGMNCSIESLLKKNPGQDIVFNLKFGNRCWCEIPDKNIQKCATGDQFCNCPKGKIHILDSSTHSVRAVVSRNKGIKCNSIVSGRSPNDVCYCEKQNELTDKQ